MDADHPANGVPIPRLSTLWKRLKAKEENKPYGTVAVGKVWSWYEAWLKRVREECEQNPDKYRTPVAGDKAAQVQPS